MCCLVLCVVWFFTSMYLMVVCVVSWVLRVGCCELGDVVSCLVLCDVWRCELPGVVCCLVFHVLVVNVGLCCELGSVVSWVVL